MSEGEVLQPEQERPLDPLKTGDAKRAYEASSLKRVKEGGGGGWVTLYSVDDIYRLAKVDASDVTEKFEIQLSALLQDGFDTLTLASVQPYDVRTSFTVQLQKSKEPEKVVQISSWLKERSVHAAEATLAVMEQPTTESHPPDVAHFKSTIFREKLARKREEAERSMQERGEAPSPGWNQLWETAGRFDQRQNNPDAYDRDLIAAIKVFIPEIKDKINSNTDDRGIFEELLGEALSVIGESGDIDKAQMQSIFGQIITLAEGQGDIPRVT